MPSSAEFDRSPPHAPSLTRRGFVQLGGAAATLLPVWSARASYATRPVTLVVPYTAGGAADIGARMIQADLAKALEQPVLVENIGGASGALGVQKVVRAAPDGHTLLYGSLSDALLVPLTNRSAGYTPSDLLPVAYGGGSPVVLVTRPDFPAQNLDEFIAEAKRRPGRLSYGSPGIGTFQHVMGEAFKAQVGVFMVHIPYRGGAQILTDVIGGQIDLGITTAVNAAGFIANGRLKALGVSQRSRLSAMPAVQAFGEVKALQGLELSTWAVVYAPAATPDAVAAQINAAVNSALMTPANVQARARLGAELASPLSPAQTRAFVQAEQAKYEPILRSLKTV